MIWFLSIIGFLLLLVILLVTLPLEVEIDTERNIYRAEWTGIFGFWAFPEEGQWKMFFRVFGFEKEIKSGKGEKTSTEKTTFPNKKKKKSAKSTFSLRFGYELFKNLLKAIRVRRFYINLDTGDYAKNALLYPLFFYLSKGSRQLQINFAGHNELAIHLQTRLYKLAGAFLRAFIHHKK